MTAFTDLPGGGSDALGEAIEKVRKRADGINKAIYKAFGVDKD